MGAWITGMGSVCALGRGMDALWSGIIQGKDGIQTVHRFSTEGFKTSIAGMVSDRNRQEFAQQSITDLNIEFALDAAREAWKMARLDDAVTAKNRIALVLGTSLGDFQQPLHVMTETVAKELGITGPIITVSTACSSSTNALGLGLDLLRQGFADIVIAGGTDVLNPTMLAGFNSLGVLSKDKCSPFSLPFGTTLGEGAGFLVLEKKVTAESRNAKNLGVLMGYGLSGDAYHETSPDPTGSGVARAISAALGDSKIEANKIGYVNAHGTGTSANDPAEWQAVLIVFGPDAHHIPVSSTKSYLGHTQGACGVLELLVTLMSMQAQMVPPTLNFTTARKHGPSDPVFALTPRPHNYEYAVCTNSAFGGANAAVVVGLPEKEKNRPTQIKKTVYVVGVGALGAHGLKLEAILPAFESGILLNAGRVPGFSWSEILPNVDPRGLDPSSRFLTAAAGMAISDAGLKLKRTRNDRMGLIMGINYPSPESSRALDKSIKQNGLPLLSTTAFSRMVLNAPAGTCSKLLSLGGPLSTVSTGPGCGLMAIAYAADLLQSHEGTDYLIAGGLDELDSELLSGNTGEGAACAVLTTSGKSGEESIVIAGWGIAGANGCKESIRLACQSANCEEDSLEVVFGSGLENLFPDRVHVDPSLALGLGAGFSSSMAFITAVMWLRKGLAETVLVADGNGNSTTCAIILSRKGKNEN